MEVVAPAPPKPTTMTSASPSHFLGRGVGAEAAKAGTDAAAATPANVLLMKPRREAVIELVIVFSWEAASTRLLIDAMGKF